MAKDRKGHRAFRGETRHLKCCVRATGMRMKIKMRMLDHFMKHLEHPKMPRQGTQKLILQRAVDLQRFHSRG